MRVHPCASPDDRGSTRHGNDDVLRSRKLIDALSRRRHPRTIRMASATDACSDCAARVGRVESEATLTRFPQRPRLHRRERGETRRRETTGSHTTPTPPPIPPSAALRVLRGELSSRAFPRSKKENEGRSDQPTWSLRSLEFRGANATPADGSAVAVCFSRPGMYPREPLLSRV